jgi:hypothetical protein
MPPRPPPTNTLPNLQVGTRGGRLLAARCELSGNSSHGLSIGEGATADLRDCRLRANGASGLRVGGVGSMAVLRSCELSGNRGVGVAVAAGGCASLDGCTASGNGAGPMPVGQEGAGADVGDGKGNESAGGSSGSQQETEVWREAEQGGHGLLVEGSGARVTALRCAFFANAGRGVQVGSYGSVQLQGCGVHRNGRGRSSAGAGPVGLQPQPQQADKVGSWEEAGGESTAETEPGVVEVEVEAHGRVSMSKGCSWGPWPASASSGGEAGGEGSAAPGGPDCALRVAESGCLERSDNA